MSSFFSWAIEPSDIWSFSSEEGADSPARPSEEEEEEEEEEDDQSDDEVEDEPFDPEEELIHDLLPLQSEARSPSLSQTSSPNRRSFPSQRERREHRPCE